MVSNDRISSDVHPPDHSSYGTGPNTKKYA